MKREKSIRPKANFSGQFIPAEDTEAIIAEKLSKKAAKRARRQKKKQDDRLNNLPEQEWREISLSNPPPVPAQEKGDFSVVVPSISKKRKRKNAVQEDNFIKNDGYVELNSLEWSEVNYPDSIFMGDDLGGFLCLEEIDDIDVEYDDNKDTQGKTIKFKKVKSSNRLSNAKSDSPCAKPEEPLPEEESSKYYDLDTFDESILIRNKNIREYKQSEENVGSQDDNFDNNIDQYKDDDENDEDEIDNDSKMEESVSTNINSIQDEKGTDQNAMEGIDLSAWNQFNLSPIIMNELKSLGFNKPTPIQAKTLHFSLSGRDVIGAAETGSGKTLAFGIPILEYIFKKVKDSNQLVGLILTPTRELAMQIRDHLQHISKNSLIKIITIVGGMATQKQQRLLSKHPNIIVATPGRLWELFSENDAYLSNLRRIKFLVLDEADRMLEIGHFEELNHILTVLSRTRNNTNEWAENDIKEKECTYELTPRQTFVYSATLNNKLKEDLKRKKYKSKKINKESTGTMTELMHRLEFNDSNPIFLDITPEDAVAETLQESKIDCLTKEKDIYTYYFYTRYPGRTLIFVNSIDCIRRLIPVIKLLNIDVFGLHAQMQQRQRLKNLDRFKQNPKAVMIASDVAARGLDIPLVEHVIHYQLPRSSDIYVHRSGRTARSRKEGVSLMLCSPEELSLYQKLCLKLNKVDGLADFPVDRGILNSMKQRINLARQIDQDEHKMQKMNHDNDWLKKTAQEFEIDLDDEEIVNDSNRGNQKQIKEKIRSMKLELKSLLSQPLIPRGVSTKYLTSGIVRDLADRLLDESSHNSAILGVKNTKATDDLRSKKKTIPL
ncbi:P-loop containing nucleoside triphosphate hydrolase protein [Rhizophagus irregularis]|uniref:ATP-dependent RNA helicase n=2 Tax=Rhizophagus irregularis TaxID=588596 RepID=A0A2N1NNK7_9GLOM|nr:P-loop containing nucleoside triphosphate hydrolase protein [Rhizophagus irregularis]